MFNPLKYFRNRKVGLVLGSGGAKGLAHVAVLEYLMSKGIPIHMIAGSSIGAIVGAVYCAGSFRQFRKDILRLKRREMLSFIDPVLSRSGLVEGKKFMTFMERYIPADFDFSRCRVPLAVAATDYSNGKSVVFRNGSVSDALRASMSIPGVFTPVRYRDTFLIDGGVANPLPINVAKKMGAGIIIAVNLHPKISRRKLKQKVKGRGNRWSNIVDARDLETVSNDPRVEIKGAPSMGNWVEALEHWLGLNKEGHGRRPPSIFDVISRSIDIMEFNNTVLTLKYNTPDVLLEPDLIHVPTLDFSAIPEILTEGYRACSAAKGQLFRRVKIWT